MSAKAKAKRLVKEVREPHLRTVKPHRRRGGLRCSRQRKAKASFKVFATSVEDIGREARECYARVKAVETGEHTEQVVHFETVVETESIEYLMSVETS